MTQENDKGVDYPKILFDAATFIDTDEAGNAFPKLSDARQGAVIARLKRGLKVFDEKYKETMQRQKEAFGLKPGEWWDYDEAIKRIFRKNGKYLDFSSIEDFTEEVLDDLFNSPMRSTIKIYRSHMKIHGHDSIAHLCLDGPLFFDLTHGLTLKIGETVREIKVNTIPELRAFISDTLENQNAIFIRNGNYRTDGQILFASRYGESEYIHTNILLAKLISKRDEWDAIPEAAVSPYAPPGTALGV